MKNWVLNCQALGAEPKCSLGMAVLGAEPDVIAAKVMVIFKTECGGP